MNRIHLCARALCLSVLLSVPAAAGRAEAAAGSDSLASLARLATSRDRTASTAAIAALRSAGYPGLRALLDAAGSTSPRICWSAASPGPSQEWGRWCAAVDSVAAQRDASVSGLYWYTDLAKAKEAARLSGKPILSLRLLGRLDEELSCANSRFFRVALYANPEIAALLRDHFVLHWKSERPVPKITIDFGDGRRLERTITGNSVHYLLDADGRPLDALPGLYGPQAFVRWLEEAIGLARRLASERMDPRVFLSRYHAQRLLDSRTRLAADRASAGLAASQIPLLPAPPAAGAIAASVAMPLALSKMLVETPLLKAFSAMERSQAAADDPTQWSRLAAIYADQAHLDATSRALLGREESARNPDEALRNLEASMAIDTVRNEYLLHSRIHAWFVRGEETRGLEPLNQRVYAELFLTPRTDPWLGLLPADRYAALSNGGVREASAAPGGTR